ncbi:TlpA family protein disulfide reductase [Gillisia sp. CAL575]|uniref:TlpA family protein disulfide reductase n=1 Tax=Gillisia sp. CAL575 TaxID=985255 RepID=UPI0003A69929|nr:hypothetical protein [Gillisia sp. CAL575]
MRHIKIIIVFFFFSFQIFAQNEIKVQREVKRIDTEFSIDKLFNKNTGKKISEKEFGVLVTNNPNLQLERIYDNKGNIVKYLYNPDKENSVSTNNKDFETLEKGEYFSKLVFKTIDGETIKIKDLKGKMVILRMEMEADTFRFKKHEIADLDAKINLSNKKSEIAAIIIFDATKQQIHKGFDLIDSNFKLIPDGYNFHQKLNIRYFPTTLILDKKGKLIREFQRTDEIDILDLLSKS